MPKKVLIPILIICSGVVWLLSSNFKSGNYFVPVNEMAQYGDQIYHMNLRVKGRIVPGSIRKDQRPVTFTIAEEGHQLDVVYVGEEPLPDLFKDRAEAVVTGKLSKNNVFEAVHLQAKCASKYEAEGYEGTDYPAETDTKTIVQPQPGSSP